MGRARQRNKDQRIPPVQLGLPFKDLGLDCACHHEQALKPPVPQFLPLQCEAHDSFCGDSYKNKSEVTPLPHYCVSLYRTLHMFK